ncbi:MAG TPA: hypothetical protein VGE77_13085 [Nocardioides sp.]
MTLARQVALGLAVAVAGAVSGLASVVVGGHWWGVLLAAVAAAAALVALPGRLARCGFAGGWVAMLLVVLQWTPGGDFAIASNAKGYALLGLGLAVAVAGIVALAGGPRSAPPNG